MRYAVPYIRVSHADEKRGLTMDLQLDAIRTYAARQGLQLEPECVYADEGRSAFTNRIDKRPAFQRLLRDARAEHRYRTSDLVVERYRHEQMQRMAAGRMYQDWHAHNPRLQPV